MLNSVKTHLGFLDQLLKDNRTWSGEENFLLAHWDLDLGGTHERSQQTNLSLWLTVGMGFLLKFHNAQNENISKRITPRAIICHCSQLLQTDGITNDVLSKESILLSRVTSIPVERQPKYPSIIPSSGPPVNSGVHLRYCDPGRGARCRDQPGISFSSDREQTLEKVVPLGILIQFWA